MLDAEAGTNTDASDACAPALADGSPYCLVGGIYGVCATADGGETCGNGGNGTCAPQKGFYGECSRPSDCTGNLSFCVVSAGAVVTPGCPQELSTGPGGVTVGCANASYVVMPGVRVACASDSDCLVVADAGAPKCVSSEIVGYPALAGVAIGICSP